ncbi:hypothetical protein SCHPADRAFT_625815 [Schizopora paradoxa]|uniref:Uncharacterized protein n=1 Tax=Schizopora paradoxa TaxID=27342 RepID=A0A0H2R853_9AGAM|nr:hypothetical protein SCHPADRAFT_625815 [Schizopora paradoxa]
MMLLLRILRRIHRGRPCCTRRLHTLLRVGQRNKSLANFFQTLQYPNISMQSLLQLHYLFSYVLAPTAESPINFCSRKSV